MKNLKNNKKINKNTKNNEDFEEKENFSHCFKKSLGQNFLFDKNLLRAICADAGVTKNDTVLEIGAGAGTLTEILSENAKRVLSFEIDKSLILTLENLKNKHKNLTFFYEDFMKVDLCELLKDFDDVKVVANIPYYITTPIIFKLLTLKQKFSSIVVLVQKEVALRFAGMVNTKDYGITSVVLQSVFDVSVPRIVKKENFTPQPKIDSAICKFVPHNKFKDFDFEKFEKFVSKCFSMRRKTLVNNLKNDYSKEKLIEILLDLGFDENVRPEQIDVKNYVELFKMLDY